jgi:hypothetical protein
VTASDRAQLERDKLRGYVAASRRLQRRLVIGVVVAAAVALGGFAVVPTVAAFALLAIGCVAICGLWITTSHIADWRAQLARLDRRDR